MSVIEGLFGLGNLRQGVEQNLRQQDLDIGRLIGQATTNTYADPQRQKAHVDQLGAYGALSGMAVRGLGGLFGIEDPQLQRASSLEGILQSTQQELGADANDPTKFYPALQQKLSAGGFQREAAQVMDASSKLIGDLGVSQAKMGAENARANKFKADTLKTLREDDPQQKLFFKLAEKASPQSVKAAVEGGYDLALLDSPEVQKFSPDAQRLIDAGLQYGSPEFNAAMLDIIDSDKSGKRRGSGADVTVNLGEKNQGIITKEVDIPIVKGFSENADAARTLAKDSRTIADLLKNAEGGQMVKLTTRLSKDLGLQNETISANDLANALATKGAVGIRATGSGSTSDLEFKAYLEAFPSLANSQQGRQLMATYAEKMADRQEKLADFGRQLIVNNTFSQQAINAYDKSLGPVLDEQFYSFQAGTPANPNKPKINPKTKAVMDKYLVPKKVK